MQCQFLGLLPRIANFSGGKRQEKHIRMSCLEIEIRFLLKTTRQSFHNEVLINNYAVIRHLWETTFWEVFLSMEKLRTKKARICKFSRFFLTSKLFALQINSCFSFVMVSVEIFVLLKRYLFANHGLLFPRMET